MPPRKSETLTEAELRLMDVLWLKGSATVQQVLDALPQKPALAYNSVLTTIRVLENKGYVKHVKDGRAHIYIPTSNVRKPPARKSGIWSRRFFKDSHELLVLNILEDRGIEAKELSGCANSCKSVEGREKRDDGNRAQSVLDFQSFSLQSLAGLSPNES